MEKYRSDIEFTMKRVFDLENKKFSDELRIFIYIQRLLGLSQKSAKTVRNWEKFQRFLEKKFTINILETHIGY